MIKLALLLALLAAAAAGQAVTGAVSIPIVPSNSTLAAPSGSVYFYAPPGYTSLYTSGMAPFGPGSSADISSILGGSTWAWCVDAANNVVGCPTSTSISMVYIFAAKGPVTLKFTITMNPGRGDTVSVNMNGKLYAVNGTRVYSMPISTSLSVPIHFEIPLSTTITYSVPLPSSTSYYLVSIMLTLTAPTYPTSYTFSVSGMSVSGDAWPVYISPSKIVWYSYATEVDVADYAGRPAAGSFTFNVTYTVTGAKALLGGGFINLARQQCPSNIYTWPASATVNLTNGVYKVVTCSVAPSDPVLLPVLYDDATTQPIYGTVYGPAAQWFRGWIYHKQLKPTPWTWWVTASTPPAFINVMSPVDAIRIGIDQDNCYIGIPMAAYVAGIYLPTGATTVWANSFGSASAGVSATISGCKRLWIGVDYIKTACTSSTDCIYIFPMALQQQPAYTFANDTRDYTTYIISPGGAYQIAPAIAQVYANINGSMYIIGGAVSTSPANITVKVASRVGSTAVTTVTVVVCYPATGACIKTTAPLGRYIAVQPGSAATTTTLLRDIPANIYVNPLAYIRNHPMPLESLVIATVASLATALYLGRKYQDDNAGIAMSAVWDAAVMVAAVAFASMAHPSWYQLAGVSAAAMAAKLAAAALRAHQH